MGDCEDELAKFLSTAVQAAKLAGEIISNNFYKTKAVEYKGQVWHLSSQSNLNLINAGIEC